RYDGFNARPVETVERSRRQIVIELASVCGELRLEIVEHCLGESKRICRGPQHQRRHSTDERGPCHAAFAVTGEIVHNLAAARGMADVNRILQVEVSDHRREVVSVMVHVVAVASLRRAAVTAPVMGDYSIALAQEEQHLRVPIIGGQRPAVTEHDGLTFAPILIENLNAVLGYNLAHATLPSLWSWCLRGGY